MITLQTKIQDTSLPKSIKTILLKYNIQNINDLTECNISRLIGFKSLGISRITEIREYLKNNNFNLK